MISAERPKILHPNFLLALLQRFFIREAAMDLFSLSTESRLNFLISPNLSIQVIGCHCLLARPMRLA
jgi:hypothetical protein